MRIFFDSEQRYTVRDARSRCGGELGKAIARWRDAALSSYLPLPFLFFELLYSEEIERLCGADPVVNVVALPVVVCIVCVSLVFLFEAPYLGGSWFASHRDQAEKNPIPSEAEVARQVLLDLEGQGRSVEGDGSSSNAAGHSDGGGGREEWRSRSGDGRRDPRDARKRHCDDSYLENLLIKAEMVTFLVFGCGALFAPEAMIDLLHTYNVIQGPLVFYQKLFGVGCLSIAAACWQIDCIPGPRPVFERRIHALSLLLVVLFCTYFNALAVVHDVPVVDGFFLVPLCTAAFSVVL
eukprot:CAMPEP_0114606460 /NCGR_PEP_ID=MMETSP0168-20121206/1575_1 /TAXON_ID=95228 ORGANISM="Vannella sp., Strain DIVA3 517/6/12" /NCGR_SAMPLE_ID=MMETSP0168 /ASSEMBLY_ACC=CAM_ASM_000044 /LENGTH=293 /DNA_ID=CAMNT_0001817329 /DNA_START=303 /DNA_END=1180 /DNA_ORIENTATION=+